MSERLVIDGWTCRVVRGQRSAMDYVAEVGAWLLPDGRLKTEGAEGDADPVTVVVPPAVLAWICAPLLAKAWEEGHTVGVGHFRGDPRRNPYEESGE